MIIRKTIGLPEKTWSSICNARFEMKLPTQNSSLEYLIGLGIKAHLGKRPIAQYNYQAKLKRKEKANAKR